MNRLIPIFILCLSFFQVKGQYESNNMSLLSRFDDPGIAPSSLRSKYSSVFGFYDAQKKKEYAILGAASGTYIVDVTNPYNPVKLAFFPGRRGQCIWREYSIYKNYLYAVSDDGDPNSLQIIDLAPPVPTKVYDSDSIFIRSHTVFVDGNKLYGGSVKTSTSSYSMAVYSLENPLNPKLLRTLNDDYPAITSVHDMFVRNDTIYASCGYQGLHVYKFNSNNTFSELGSIENYPDKGYNHSTSLSPNGKTLVMCDEVGPGLAVKILDVSDLSDIKVLSTFKSHQGATGHNPYYLDNKVVISYYLDGVQIVDLKNPEAPIKAGYFDTYPENNDRYHSDTVYNGCWGAYPYLPSKVILASDMQRGLFVLKPYYAPSNLGPESVFPQPFTNNLNVQIKSTNGEEITLEIFDALGVKVLSEKHFLNKGENLIQLNTISLKTGLYVLRYFNYNLDFRAKLIKGFETK